MGAWAAACAALSRRAADRECALLVWCAHTPSTQAPPEWQWDPLAVALVVLIWLLAGYVKCVGVWGLVDRRRK